MYKEKELILEVLPLKVYGEDYYPKVKDYPGYIWAPFIPMYVTSHVINSISTEELREKYIGQPNTLITQENFKKDVEIMAQHYADALPRLSNIYSEKPINPNYYGTGIIGTTSITVNITLNKNE